DGVSTPTFPAGDRGVMGVAATDPNDSLVPFSNSGPSTFIAAPGTDIQTTTIGDAYTVISGTSASAAIVGGAAAFMRAVDPTLSNGVIVFRIASTADPAGTQAQTGNGRINMARALADTGIDFIQPAGAAPVGAGGPFVGPYVAAAADNTSTVVSCSPSSVAIGQASACTATVTDTDSAQNNKNPPGTVGFTASYSSGSGTSTVTGSPCTLSAVGGTTNQSSCPVTS